MRAYIVNLLRSADRRAYMARLLADVPEVDAEFIAAVDGRAMSEEERARRFDAARFARLSLRHVREGEIGCTLSHQACYRRLLTAPERFALILEDDIELRAPLAAPLAVAERLLDTDAPRLVLLSSWFWYTSARDAATIVGKEVAAATPMEGLKVCKVVDGCLAHAYALNKAAARLMIDDRPWYVSDEWARIRRRGVQMFAFSPYPVAQQWDGTVASVIQDHSIKKAPFHLDRYLYYRYRGLVRNVLQLFGHFEEPFPGFKGEVPG